LILELNLLGHIDWAVRAIEPAAGVEFYVWLERKRETMPDVEANELRLSLLMATIRETQDAIAQLGKPFCDTHQNPAIAHAGTAPTIGVVIPLFNGSQYIEKALASVFRQTLLPSEVVVVNDGSTDGGVDIVERLARKYPIKLVQTRNGGQSAARNIGVRETRSDLIAFLDQDDDQTRVTMPAAVSTWCDDCARHRHVSIVQCFEFDVEAIEVGMDVRHPQVGSSEHRIREPARNGETRSVARDLCNGPRGLRRGVAAGDGHQSREGKE